jgi:serine/threonine protein kinase HipA of HipAB toxin-antitoxin module
MGIFTLTQSADPPAESFFGSLFNRAKSTFSKWREVGRLDSQEIEAAARDLSISSAELVSLMFTPSESLDQLYKRLAYAGLPEAALAASHPDELRDLRRVCGQCVEKRRCARDIRHKRMATPSKYCPNELTLRTLAREACQARSAQVLAFPARPS